MGIITKSGGSPEVWDSLFTSNAQWWVTIRFKDGSGYYGLSGEISASPSVRQIFLTQSKQQTNTPSLYRFRPNGELVEDLTQVKAMEKNGVWVRITNEVIAVELYR